MKEIVNVIKIGRVSKQTLGHVAGTIWEIGRPHGFIVPYVVPPRDTRKKN